METISPSVLLVGLCFVVTASFASLTVAQVPGPNIGNGALHRDLTSTAKSNTKPMLVATAEARRIDRQGFVMQKTVLKPPTPKFFGSLPTIPCEERIE